MALHQGNECFTQWTHVEPGQVFHRRLHRIVLQPHDGGPETITGDRLPDFLQTCTGHAYVGVDLPRILLSRQSLSKRLKRHAPRLPATSRWWLPQEAKSRLEALRQTIECSTRLDHVENGQPVHRQIRRIEVLRHGRLHILTGKRLPEFIGICTGQGFKGQHSAQILLHPGADCEVFQEQTYWPPAIAAWPQLRDVVHIGLGLTGFLAIRFLLNLIASMA